MNLVERTRASRTWDEDERMVLAQVQRIADKVLAPNSARFDAAEEFP